MNSITNKSIELIIKNVEYKIIGKKTTICCITLTNSFEIIGFSSCVDANNFNKEIGEKISYENAFNKIWELEGYYLQCILAGRKQNG